ncbi:MULTISPECIES: BolA/IbaG family iron-sulfur metabolism protein [Ehrlichia]|uniref:BolA-like family protein n=1 Tax=Ehrlichia cf. muris str. EmCRT TaxID=1359167 RepID=A0A0F3N6H3_9RICK|nr:MULTISPECIES: BolA family protein [Ehrlichia]KJV63326.1 bolA-like family protein [Ehrlichia cf. muris str. EmCRT]OUC04294.1 bolA protein [Ehrlichia sp. Wisconsin_h]
MNIIQKIKNKIISELNVLKLEIIDESLKHRDHIFQSAYSISHLKVQLVSNDFLEITRINRHKLLHKILEGEIKLIHSISFSLYTEAEYNILLEESN